MHDGIMMHDQCAIHTGWYYLISAFIFLRTETCSSTPWASPGYPMTTMLLSLTKNGEYVVTQAREVLWMFLHQIVDDWTEQ